MMASYSNGGVLDAQSKEALMDLRQRFRQESLTDRIISCDMNRLLNDDWWPLSFLKAYRMDVDVVYAILLECLKWRQSFDVHHISLLELKPLLDRRVAYIHGRDLQGRSILWINMKQHKSGDRIIEKLFIYWLERHSTELYGAPLTVLFEMTSCGLQNMDLDFMKFFIRAFKYYYPSCLESLLVFENPTVLNASWKLIRSWMDASVQRLLQHVNRNSLQRFLPSQCIPVNLGGEDEFMFTMDDLARCIPSQSSSNSNRAPAGDQQQEQSPHFISPDLDNFAAKRQAVKFDEDEAATRSKPLTTPSRSTSVSKRNGGVPATLKPLAESRINSASSDCFKTSFLTICPREELRLGRVEGEESSVDIVVLKNTGSKNMMFKIKITSPEKFRVRPSLGSIAAGATELVRIYLQNEYKHSVNKEKILLMALETDGKTSEDFSLAWKNTDEKNRIEHKLRCRLADNNIDNGLPPVYTPVANHMRTPSNVQTQDKVHERIAQLAHQQQMLFICIIIVIVLQLISLGCQRSYHASLLSKENCNTILAKAVDVTDMDSDL